MVKKSFLFFISFAFTISVCGQSSLYYSKDAEKKECEETLVTTFSKYFNKPKAAEPVKAQPASPNVITKYASDFYNSTIDNIIAVGKTFLGIPYRWGGTSESGFDCSGFIKYIFEWFGVKLPRTSKEMANYGAYVSKTELQKGDLIFFTGRNSNSGVIGHIGIVVEVTSEAIKMMHSSSSQGVHIEDLNKSDYFKRRYLTARRLQIEQPATTSKN